MPIVKLGRWLAVWWRPRWLRHLGTKGNWRRARYYGSRKITWLAGRYELGPFRVDVNLARIAKRG